MLAAASGPVFVSPFDRAGLATSAVDKTIGTVLGGALVKDPRKVRLVLNDPRYSIAQQIVSRLNGRYAKADPIADAKGPSTVELTIPAAFNERKRVFLERVLHTTLQENQAMLERRAKDLGDEIKEEQAEYESIGLAWEAIGKVALPVIREHYHDSKPESNYYAARTGLRLMTTKMWQPLRKRPECQEFLSSTGDDEWDTRPTCTALASSFENYLEIPTKIRASALPWAASYRTLPSNQVLTRTIWY
jgi:hypothetical protein